MKALIVIVRDLHLGYLGCYGNEWIATPALDRFAAEAAVFDEHFSDCPSADGAVRAWRTGRYQFSDFGAPTAPAPDLIEQLSKSAVHTRLLTASGTQYGVGWQHVRSVEGRIDAVLESASKELDALSNKDDWLLWLDLGSVGPPWNVPDELLARYFTAEMHDDEEENAEEQPPLEPLLAPASGFLDARDETIFLRLQRTYAGAVTMFDAGLEALLEEVRERGLDDDLLVIITTDRGLALGEHGFVGEGRAWLHEEVTHLPLLFRWPKQIEAGLRLSALTQPIDLLPTLLDAFGKPMPEVHGKSLLPLLRQETSRIREYAWSALAVGESAEWALRSADWTFLMPLRTPPDDPPRPVQLYLRPEDRWEVNNVVQHHLELSDALERTLKQFGEAVRQPGPLRPPKLPTGGFNTEPVMEESAS